MNLTSCLHEFDHRGILLTLFNQTKYILCTLTKTRGVSSVQAELLAGSGGRMMITTHDAAPSPVRSRCTLHSLFKLLV